MTSYLRLMILALNLIPFSVLKAETSKSPRPLKPFVVVIDAGHGGKDTGAIGPSGRYEKDVVLATARKLHLLLQHDPNISSVMVRNHDAFVDLKTRALTARKVRADLFISLHADANVNNTVEGASVYILSETKASSEAARILAEHENSSEELGIHIKTQDKALKSILMDLSKNATLEASEIAAKSIMRSISREFPVHNSEVQKAGFLVLKSLSVPSVLIELAFISNPNQEAKICDSHHQDLIAKALFRGVQEVAHADIKTAPVYPQQSHVP